MFLKCLRFSILVRGNSNRNSAFLSKRIKLSISSYNTMSKTYTTMSYVTAPDEIVARQLSQKLIEQRLAACINILRGVESIYEWQGRIEHDSEVLMIIKSHSGKSTELADFVTKNHPYDCPEVVTVQVDSGSKKYLDWVENTVNQKISAHTFESEASDQDRGTTSETSTQELVAEIEK